VKRSEVFSTAEDNQTAVDIHVLQGERPLANDNMSLGRFRLEGIPAAPRGMPQVEVTFDIDANGIINVGARDKATGIEQKVTITASTNLSKAEIDKMVQQAREHETEDRHRKELIEARNTADSIIYQTEKTLKELAEKVPENDRQAIISKLATLRETMLGEDILKIKEQSDELQNAFHALSQQLHASQEQPGQPGFDHAGGYSSAPGYSTGGNGNGSSKSPDDEGEVVEGEFREA
jgi:molecular chaperone DnaK